MPSSKQQKGYRSNGKVRKWLLESGFTWIYFHPHPTHADLITVDKDTDLYARDLFNLFDGMAIGADGDLFFFQVKTNAWADEKRIREWVKGKKVAVLSFNVKDRQGVFCKAITDGAAFSVGEQDPEQIEDGLNI